MLLGGTLTATLAYLVGAALLPWLRPAAPVALIVVATWIVLVELRLVPQKWPAAHRQVPSSIVARSSFQGPLQFGFEMGTGARTYMPSPLPHLALASILLVAEPWSALLIGLSFGAGRAAMTTLRYYSGDVDEWDRRLRNSGRRIVWAMTLLAPLALLMLAPEFGHWA